MYVTCDVGEHVDRDDDRVGHPLVFDLPERGAPGSASGERFGQRFGGVDRQRRLRKRDHDRTADDAGDPASPHDHTAPPLPGPAVGVRASPEPVTVQRQPQAASVVWPSPEISLELWVLA
jgi:hypothetical protein